MKRLILILLIILLSPQIFSETKKIIFTTILPQKWVVDRIVGDKFEVISIVDKGRDYHTFEITPSLLKKIGEASVYFSLGFGDAEKNMLDKVRGTFPNLRIVDVSSGVYKLRYRHRHHHSSHHQHHHGRFDPHIWTSPLNMKIVAKNVYEEVVRIDPQNKDFYQKNYQKLLEDLDKLHEELKQILEPVRGKKFMVFHSTFRYFERDYDVYEVAIEQEGKEPTPKELSRIIEEAKRNNIKVVFTQPAFSQNSARIIANEIGGRVVEIDHVDYEYIENMKKIATLIRESYN